LQLPWQDYGQAWKLTPPRIQGGLSVKVKIRAIIATAIILMLAGVTAQAMPQPAYFLQDDFVLTFGAKGDPLAVGTNIHTIDYSTRLLNWNDNNLAGWFHLDATLGSAGQTSNGAWVLNFTTGTFSITEKPTGGQTYWSGAVDQLTLMSHTDPSLQYPAAGYARPAYEGEPTEFVAVGAGKFSRTSGTWADPQLELDWAGSYNWNYDANTPQDSTSIIGNMQAKLIAPEPASAVALMSGLVGLVGFWYKKRA
jgi:hypothetical protein